MTVVFTGDDPRWSREELTARAERLGLVVGKSVTKATDLLVAYDTASNSGKAGKARSYGVPIVSTTVFAASAIGDVLDAEGASVEAREGRHLSRLPCHLDGWRRGPASERRSAVATAAPRRRRAPHDRRHPPRWPGQRSRSLTCTHCAQTLDPSTRHGDGSRSSVRRARAPRPDRTESSAERTVTPCSPRPKSLP